jgi:hypothetical protein
MIPKFKRGNVQQSSSWQKDFLSLDVNAGEKMYQRAGVKLRHGWMPNAPTGGLLLRDNQDEKRIASPARFPRRRALPDQRAPVASIDPRAEPRLPF